MTPMQKNALQVAAVGIVLALGCWWLVSCSKSKEHADLGTISIETGSMEPVLHLHQTYDTLTPADAPYSDIKVDQIIVYDASFSDFPVPHRVIRMTLDGPITKGDANAQEDPYPVKSNQYRGTVKL
jgi:signal peptidase I